MTIGQSIEVCGRFGVFSRADLTRFFLRKSLSSCRGYVRSAELRTFIEDPQSFSLLEESPGSSL